MCWTNDRPAADGWYWLRTPGCRPEIVEVIRGEVWHGGVARGRTPDGLPAGAEWWGPIPEPDSPAGSPAPAPHS